ncbi:MAG: organic solvent ABC transporter substrate-binding protein [Acidobacteria bacterium 13_1_20CM_4_56_7]|nr:MAG: organic solvent ABC transporter substrate-binding protein [Acidobacteria bacterium 13_1_20CM_4_56_7]
MPSQKQLKWSQLKVGITVVAASVVFLALVFLMSGSGGLFTRKIVLKSYFFDAQGVRVGAPVRLSGVDIGNVSQIRIVPNQPLAPVEVTMKINTKYTFNLKKDSKTLLSTAGVLGETYINIDSSKATGAEVRDGDVLPTSEEPGYQDVMRSTQNALQNMQALLARMDRIVAFVESGQGSVGKLIYDAALYNRINATVNDFQKLVGQVAQGQGSLGKLLNSTELYDKANASLDKINVLIDDLNSGKGTAGKLLKDPSLYDAAQQTVTNFKQLTDDINSGKGALGKLTKDQEFANKLQNTMNRISNITDRLDKGEGTAGRFLHDPSLYDNTNKLLTDSQELVKAIRQNPKKYLTIHLKVF